MQIKCDDGVSSRRAETLTDMNRRTVTRPDYDEPSVFLPDRFVGVLTAALLIALACAIAAKAYWAPLGGGIFALVVLCGLGFYYPPADRRSWWRR